MTLTGADKITQIAFRKHVTALVNYYQHRPARGATLKAYTPLFVPFLAFFNFEG